MSKLHEKPKYAQDKWYVGPPLHISISCLLGRCLIAMLEVSFMSVSNKSPTK